MQLSQPPHPNWPPPLLPHLPPVIVAVQGNGAALADRGDCLLVGRIEAFALNDDIRKPVLAMPPWWLLAV